MLGLARWCIAHRRRVVVAWVAVAILTTVVAQAVGPNYVTVFSLPGTESQRAVDLLKRRDEARLYPHRPLYEPSGYPFDSGERCSRPPAAGSVRSRRRRRVRGGGRGGPRPIGTSPRSGRRAYSRIIRAHRSGCRGTRASIQRADVRGTGCAIGGRLPLKPSGRPNVASPGGSMIGADLPRDRRAGASSDVPLSRRTSVG